MNKITKINITPSTSIYNIFSKLTYKHESAIAEFIDNSTQSYKDNKEIFPGLVPKIYLIYNATKGNEFFQVLDNCFGIENSNLERVLQLNVPINVDKKSRNEFGMGLKTASFWFGSNLKICSKRINEQQTVKIDMSLDNLEAIKNNEIEPVYEDALFFENHFLFNFGTIVEIKKISKKMTDNKLKKICKIFASKYKNDIETDKLELRIIKINTDNNNHTRYYDVNDCDANGKFNEINRITSAHSLTYELPKLRQENGTTLKIEIDDYLNFENKLYKIEGWVGILDIGSRNIAGLVLFRRGRSILGDEEGSRYKPYKIFRDAASFQFQRLYGQINVDDFPITQAKDNFDWEDGLEEAFIDFLYEKLTNGKNNLNLIKKATELRNRDSTLKNIEIVNEDVAKEIENRINEDNNEIKNFKMDVLGQNENQKFFKATFSDKYGKSVCFFVNPINEKDSVQDWLIIKPKAKDAYDLFLNLGLEFFSPFNNDIENVKHQIIRFAIYFAYAEINHIECRDRSNIRMTLNKLFKGEGIEYHEQK